MRHGTRLSRHGLLVCDSTKSSQVLQHLLLLQLRLCLNQLVECGIHAWPSTCKRHLQFAKISAAHRLPSAWYVPRSMRSHVMGGSPLLCCIFAGHATAVSYEAFNTQTRKLTSLPAVAAAVLWCWWPGRQCCAAPFDFAMAAAGSIVPTCSCTQAYGIEKHACCNQDG